MRLRRIQMSDEQNDIAFMIFAPTETGRIMFVGFFVSRMRLSTIWIRKICFDAAACLVAYATGQKFNYSFAKHVQSRLCTPHTNFGVHFCCFKNIFIYKMLQYTNMECQITFISYKTNKLEVNRK